jgi:O-antigen/teichoic acid export membrane protein
MATLQRNLVANFIGRGWGAVIGFVFVPFYLQFLGVEAYGLVGFFATLQALASLTDLGLGMTLNRELARLAALPGREGEQRDTLRTMEAVFVSLAICAGIAITWGADWIGGRWIGASSIPAETVTNAIRLMGLVLVLQLPSSLYQGGLLGLQKQDQFNAVNAVFSTLRSAGAVLVLWRISPTVEAFFTWQASVSVVQTLVMRWLVWRSLASTFVPARFRLDILQRVRRYAAGVAGSTIMAAGLTQADKLVLSSVLPLREFGYYTLSWSVAAALWSLVQPITAAFFPRLTHLMEVGDEKEQAVVYHTACQLVALATIPVAVTVIAFPQEVIYVWTGDRALAASTALVVQMLMAGTLLNALTSIPITLQWAAGWSQLMMWTNAVSAVCLIPAIVLLAPRYGGPGAASAWIAVNLGYVFGCVPLMHRTLLRSEMWAWYRYDLGLPLLAATTAAALCRVVVPTGASRGAAAFWLCVVGGTLLLLVAAVAPKMRRAAISRMKAMRLTAEAPSG